MKNRCSNDEILYYDYFQSILDSKKYKKALEENKELDLMGFINNDLNEIINEYKFDYDFFNEAKNCFNKFINDVTYFESVKKECKSGRKSCYDLSILDLCNGFLNNEKDYFEPSLYGNLGDAALLFPYEANIHLYLPSLKPSVFLNLLSHNYYDNVFILENELIGTKCNFVFVGLDESNEKISYEDYSFLKKYNFISPSNITKESFNVALGFERLSDDGIMIYNTHASNMYKNDSKSYLFRKYLIDNRLLKAVIFTKSYTRKVDYEVTYIITKRKNENVVFVDAGSNQFRIFYEINPYSEEYDFGNDLMNISRIVNNHINSYGISSVIACENVINKDYKFDLDEYIITDKSSKRRPLEEIEMDIRNIYDEIQENLY